MSAGKSPFDTIPEGPIMIAIHGWLCELYSDTAYGAYYSYAQRCTIIGVPNVRLVYKESYIQASCWGEGGGVQPEEFQIEYANPEFFEKLETQLADWNARDRPFVERLSSL